MRKSLIAIALAGRIAGEKGVEHYWHWYWSGPEIGWSPIG